MQLYEYFFNNKVKTVSKYLYGSRVYGSNTSDSDHDYIIVCTQKENFDKIDSVSLTSDFDNGEINVTFYSPTAFQKAIDEHEISVLECLFLPTKQFMTNRDWVFNLDLQKLRHAISQKSSNSFVKAKKKLADGEILTAQKSMFHSLRIILFAIQIAKFGKIVDYSEANHYLIQIKSLPLDWQIWQSTFQPIHNKLMSEFRVLAPKN